MHIFIISNGKLENIPFHKKLLKDADMIICADGGANNANLLKVIPDYIIGDFDSVKKTMLNHFEKTNKTVIIPKPEQDSTDTEAAISLSKAFRPKEITFLCAIGERIDHTIANIMCLEKVKGIKSQIVNKNNTIFMIEDEKANIKGKKGDIVSIIPLIPTKGITYTGLKWNVKNLDTNWGWFGICNEMTKNKATIDVKKGKVLIIKAKD
jgi:thiamine pyrophosphokinase